MSYASAVKVNIELAESLEKLFPVESALRQISHLGFKHCISALYNACASA